MHPCCTSCDCACCHDNAEEENHHCSGCWEGRFLTLFAGGAFAFDDMLLLLMSLLSLLLCWSCWSSSSSSSSPLSSTSPQIRFLESRETRQQETNHLVDVEKIVNRYICRLPPYASLCRPPLTSLSVSHSAAKALKFRRKFFAVRLGKYSDRICSMYALSVL